MTTIVVKNGVMASDSRIATDTTIVSDKQKKMVRVKFGTNSVVVGISGDYGQASLIFNMIEDFKDQANNGRDTVTTRNFAEAIHKAIMLIPKPEISVIILDKKGKIYRVVASGPCLVPEDFIAEGTGAMYAWGAFSYTDAKGCVEAAIKFDPWSGGKVNVLSP